jgi:hypothetical protein
MGPKWLACCSLELVTALLETLYEAKNQEEYHLREKTSEVGDDRLACRRVVGSPAGGTALRRQDPRGGHPV